MTGEESSIDIRILEVAQHLKSLRIARGYSSYEKFALDNDLDRKQYWRAENGSNLTLRTLLRILDIHQVTLKEFFIEFVDK